MQKEGAIDLSPDVELNESVRVGINFALTKFNKFIKFDQSNALQLIGD